MTEASEPAIGRDPTRLTLGRFLLDVTDAELELAANNKIRLEPLREAALRKLQADGAEIAGHRYRPDTEGSERT